MTTPSGYAAALASLPAIGPAALVRMLREHGPQGAWQRVCDGDISRPPGRARAPESWACAATRWKPEVLAVDLAERCIGVTWWGAVDYPEVLRCDPHPPGVLFWRGDLSRLSDPCVALVGTRRATPDGRAIAFELGRDLAAAGVAVVSGLALGVDGAAHAGALSVAGAGTVGVAASGVDVPYPLRHTDLWERVIGDGAICSETPPGQPAQGWRFPSRNRVIAGLSRLVVVVESHRAGGSLLTAEAAMARGVDVGAVPGPVRSPASDGTNQLLSEGAAPIRHAGDVLDLLGQVAAWPPPGHHLRPPRPAPTRPTSRPTPAPTSRPTPALTSRPTPALTSRPASLRSEAAHVRSELSDRAQKVLEAVPWRDASLNQIVAGTAFDVGTVAEELDDLEVAGLVASFGSWWRRVAPG